MAAVRPSHIYIIQDYNYTNENATMESSKKEFIEKRRGTRIRKHSANLPPHSPEPANLDTQSGEPGVPKPPPPPAMKKKGGQRQWNKADDEMNQLTEAPLKLFPPPPPPLPASKAGKAQSEEVFRFEQKNYSSKKAVKSKGFKSTMETEEFEEAPRQSFGLSDFLTPALLNKGKENLKNINKGEEVKLKRDGFIASASRHGALPLSRTLEYVRTQGQMSDITVLELNGTEQLTDCFFYILKAKNINLNLKLLKRISLNGCFNLTDTGIMWMTEAFKKMTYLELSGCPKLTEKSLWFITQRWQEYIVQISMQGTNIGLIPPGYEGSIKLGGCPLLSPTEKLYKNVDIKMSEKMNYPYYGSQTCKIVILTDSVLQWSPLAMINGESDVKNQKLFKTLKLTNKLDKQNRYSIFELPMQGGFSDLVLSEGSIVIMPYMIHGSDIDFDYADEIGKTLSKLITMHPQCVFVLMGMSEDPGLKETASRYGNLILGTLGSKARNLNRIIINSIESNTRVERLAFVHQKNITCGLEKNMELDSLVKKNKDQLVLQAYVCVADKPLEAIKAVTHEATECLLKRYPWLFLKFQEDLKNTLEELERLNVDLTPVKSIDQMTTPETSFLRVKFSSHGNNLIYTRKVFSLMHTRGRALYYPAVEDNPVITNFTFLETLYNSLIVGKGPTKATWRYLGNGVSCWTQTDLEKLCPNKEMVSLLTKLLEHYGILYKLPRDCWTTVIQDTYADVTYKSLPFYPAIDMVTLLTKLLEHYGILYKLPRDCWTTEIQDTYAYVTYKSLPFYPAIDMEEYWPDNLPQTDSQIDRYYYFYPDVTPTLFPVMLRECMVLGGIKLLWKTGVIIRKGPITILLEMLTNHEDRPVLYLGVRLLDGKNGASMYELMHWATFKIYKALLWDTMVEQKVYTVEYIPCPNCVTSMNRYKIVNTTQMNMIHERYCRSRNISQRDIVCENDGSTVKTQPLLGPKSLDLKDLIPSHYYLGCLPSFSASNRCMFCENCAANGATCPGNLKNGKTAWNCSCDTIGQYMCDECGLCQRCIQFLSQKYTTVYPSFQEKGSAMSLSPSAEPTELNHELSPNYIPRLEITLVRGAHIDFFFILGSTKFVYNTKKGSISEYVNKEELYTNHSPGWVGHEGYNVSVQLQFLEKDYDDMQIIFSIQGAVILTRKCSSQSVKVSMKSYAPSNIVVYMPNLKIIAPQELDDFGEKLSCMPAKYRLLPASVEASVVKMKDTIGDALFQAGGVNYSGASVVMLPETVDMATLQNPTFDKLHFTQRPTNHLLCYTRSKISDVLVQGIAAVPESWSVYRMIHFVDSAGFKLKTEAQQTFEVKAPNLLWAWHFLFKLQSRNESPENCKNLLQLTAQELEGDGMLKVQTGVHELLDLGHWRLLLRLDIDSILQDFSYTDLLSAEAENIKSVIQWNEDKLGLTKTVSHFNEESFIYLCPGHNASMRIEEGLKQVLPEIYGDYAKFLLSVDIPANHLTELPEEMFRSLPNLSEFDCSRNFIKEIPSSVSYCKNLYSLSLPENNLSDLPDSLKECKGLWRLDITSNMMEKIPAVVTKLTQLKKLYASGMFLTSLPEDFGNLVNLEKLSLNGNCFSTLPKSFARLRSLTDLGLSGVPWYGNIKAGKTLKFDEFKKRLRSWDLDRWMKANGMDTKKFFEQFDLDNNEFLDVNELSKMNSALFDMFPRFGYKGTEPPEDDVPHGFPMEILECRNLEYLSLFYQGLVSLPPEIGNLQELRILNLSHNPNLLSIPAELSTISSLTRLEMTECPLLKTPPREIRAKGFATIFGYLRRMLSGSQQCKRTKLMLVGLGGAGKTSLVNALLNKDGKTKLTQGEAITDGIDICTWTVKSGDENITYSVWDFAGQTVYYNTHQFFLSNRAVYLLLWNVRLGYEHAGLDFWLSSISVQAPNAPIFVVGSHVDQVSKYELPINEMKARYKQIAGFHFVSSYTGQGIKELQDNLYEVTLQQKYMGEQIPEVWLTLENNVVSCRRSEDVIEYSKLEEMANTSGLFEKTEIYQAVQFLHELGSLQHFTTETLKSKVVVNPQWIVDVMACVVSVKNSPIKEGRLEHRDIAVIWKDYPTELHDWLLHLTEAYDLTFPLDSEPVNLVPCLLPEKAPEFSLADVEKDSIIKRNRMIYKFDYLPAGLFNRAQFSLPDVEKDSIIKRNRMIYKFDYLPAGLFNRAQVRLHQLSDSAHIWKKGSFLNKNGHVALIQQTRDSELNVIVQGPRPENVLFLIHEVFEGLISESFAGVKYDFQIPCPDCLKLVIKEPHMFAASTIRRALELKAPFLQCVKYFHTISCVDLLACMPPDNHSDFDLHLVQTVRSLRDLRKDLAADVFISYCTKNAPADRKSCIHPATVFEDLVNIGYKCWFAERNKKFGIEEMATALTDASVFLVFISKEYVNDEECVNTFKYARLTLRKPMVVIATGDGFEWKQSKLGILLSDEVYINMNNSKKDVYKAKFDELLAALAQRTNREIGVNTAPSCFFSYTWVNSQRAVKLGTRSLTMALGHGDPREIKEYLENQGVKCWIDIERVGQNGLFDDIAEGLLSAKVVIVCVSDEYAQSSTCMMEFRYAYNVLKIPMIVAVVGRGSKWRSMEVGVLSLNFPLVSFQEKSQTAYDTLLELVQEQLRNNPTLNEKELKNEKNEKNKNLSFQELFELVQRKLLRQLSSYADNHDVGVYPRVFVLDFMKVDPQESLEKIEEEKTEKEDTQTEEKGENDKRRRLKRQESRDMNGISKRKSDLKSMFRQQRFCASVLCEHDEGWHSVSEPLTLLPDFGETMLDKFCPYIARVSAIMKYNRQIRLNYMADEVGEDFIKWLEESPLAAESDYQAVYRELRETVMSADSQKIMGKLERCRLPNGRTMWLCEKHQKAMKVTVLSTEEAAINVDFDAAESIELKMIEALRSGEYEHFSKKFVSSKTALREPDGSETVKPNMYADYDLLPDKKKQMPAISKSSRKADKLPDAKTDTTEIEEKSKMASTEGKGEGIVKNDRKTNVTESSVDTPESEKSNNSELEFTPYKDGAIPIHMIDLETGKFKKVGADSGVNKGADTNAQSKDTVLPQPIKQETAKVRQEQETAKVRQEQETAKIRQEPIAEVPKDMKPVRSKTTIERKAPKVQTQNANRPSSSRGHQEKQKSKACDIM